MKQLKDMIGICKYCEGYCLRVEDENFKPVYRCKDFHPDRRDWQILIAKELKDGRK